MSATCRIPLITSEFQGKYILAGIDGTGSRDWLKADGSNSHVWRFVQDFDAKGGNKGYFHGPGGMGLEVGDIRDNVVFFITKSLAEIRMASFQRSIQVTTNPADFRLPQWFSQTRTFSSRHEQFEYETNTRVILIGHSRGGAIAAAVANQLLAYRIPVYFVGLYDAVNRSYLMGTQTVRNARYVFHAWKALTRSRVSFERTALENQDGFYCREEFLTSHGGVGGDAFDAEAYAELPRKEPGFWGGVGYYFKSRAHFTKRLLTSPLHYAPMFSDFMVDPAYVAMDERDLLDRMIRESKRADEWMRGQARNAGLRFSHYTKFQFE